MTETGTINKQKPMTACRRPKAQTSLCTIGLPSNHNATRGFRPHRCAVGFLIAFVPFSHVPWWCSRRIACWRPACSACGWHRRDSRRSSGGWTPSRGGDRRCCRRRFRAWPTSCSCLSVVFMPMPLLPSFTFLSCLLSLFFNQKREVVNDRNRSLDGECC